MRAQREGGQGRVDAVELTFLSLAFSWFSSFCAFFD